MEIRLYYFLFRRWLWLLVLCALLGAGGAYLASLTQEPVYESSAKAMLVQPSNYLSDIGYLSNQQLVQTYAELLLTKPILDEAGLRIGAPVSKGQITVQQVRDTRLLNISAEDNDPNRAALLADTLIDVLIENNEEIQSSQFAASEQSLLTQIEIVQEQIVGLQRDIEEQTLESLENRIRVTEELIQVLQDENIRLQLEIDQLAPDGFLIDPNNSALLREKELNLNQNQGTLNIFEEIYFNLLTAEADGGTGISGSSLSVQAENTLVLYQQIYSSLLSNYESIRLSRAESTQAIVKVESAIPSEIPIRPRPLTNSVLGLAVGLMIGGAIVFLIEYLDNTVKSPEEISFILDRPILGYIPDMKGNKAINGRVRVYSEAFPRSPITESYRALRTNIEFSAVATPIKTLLITSPQAGDGKTSVASNLASVLVQSGKKVLLIDADLRRPDLHKIFSLNNRSGLSEYFRGLADINTILKPIKENMKFMVITSGKLPPNPAEILTTEKIVDLFKAVNDIVDYIILDSPPLAVTDPVVLSAQVDGVLLVVQPGVTQANSLRIAKEQLERAHAKVIGVVFNRIRRDSASYYYQDYHANYYSHLTPDEVITRPSNGSGKTQKTKTK